MRQHIIALIDCDSFYVSCERKDNPSLQGKPVCVNIYLPEIMAQKILMELNSLMF